MSLSLLAPNRTVLIISDDALYIYSTGSRGVKLVDTVPWNADSFERHVSDTISKSCGGKPVLILNDMVEQHYRKEKIPNVSVADKANVVQRKLKVAFPNYPVRAALPLKEKIARTEKSLGGSLYIFAAVPASEAFSKTMGAVRSSLAPIAGFCLLPVEACDMVSKLSERLEKRDKSKHKARWTIFVGQHQGGGLRQIVTKDGKLALTRMTPVSDHTDDSMQWANEVNQEFKATMSYLSRFGYDSSDGLNVIIISDHASGELIQDMIEASCNFYTLTLRDASSLLSLGISVLDDTHYADTLHVAWIGRKSKFILPMKAKEIERVSQPRQVAALVSVFMLLGAAFQGYQIADNFQTLSVTKGDVDDLVQTKAQLDLQYQKEVQKKEELGFDIQLIQSALAVYDSLESEKIDALPLFYSVGRALGRDMRIDRIEVGHYAGSDSLQDFIVSEQTPDPIYTAKMQMTFPSTTDAQKGNAEVQALQARIQQLMPDTHVQVTKLLEDYEYSEGIVVETGDIKNDKVSQDFVSEIRIDGPEMKK